jgi:16S rRNA (guanine1516-N2)-methyltransferase
MRPSWQEGEVTLDGAPRGSELEASASRFGLLRSDENPTAKWRLSVSLDRITIRPAHASDGSPLHLETGRSKLGQRLLGARRDDPLPRACGLHRRPTPPRVVDATAGLGRDSLVLAHLGCRVDALEREPALAFVTHLLAAACGVRDRLTVHRTDAIAWLGALAEAERPDVVYLDPMFEEHGSAQVKRDMQICRLLAGPAEAPEPLLAAARAAARERVVVKRHHGAAELAPGVSFAVPGERIRFDVYLAAPAPPSEPR